jgi:hypothetical protein
MRSIGILVGIVASLPLSLSAGEKQTKQEYQRFSRLVHSVVVRQLPKEFEDTSGWGHTIPAPEKLPFPGLRKFIKVGNKLEVPHGTWRRFKGKIEQPDKNLKIVVKDFKQIDGKNYRIILDVDVIVLTHTEIQQWQKGLLLIGGQAAIDVNMTAAIVCDVGVSLDIKKFPPELKIEPKVSELGLDLVDFKVRNGSIVGGELGDNLRNDLTEIVRGLMKASAPFLKEEANRAIVESLKEGKGTISADAIMKALPK